VQGATDLGVLADTLPGYYGLSAALGAHWGTGFGRKTLNGCNPVSPRRRSTTPHDETLTGIPVSRWIDGVLETRKTSDQRTTPVRWVLVGPTPPNSQTLKRKWSPRLEKLDLMVVVIRPKTVFRRYAGRQDGLYCCPNDQFEKPAVLHGVSNRSLQCAIRSLTPV